MCMKLKYLGTAAAEAIPAFFCTCNICTEARKRGGKNIRTRSQALIDGKLIIDFNADTLMHCINYNINLAEIDHCLITHSHSDHLYLDDINMRLTPFSNLGNNKPFNFYGSKGTLSAIENHFGGQVKGMIETHALEPYKAYEIEGYKVTALKALHALTTPEMEPVIFIIEDKAGKNLLYANDTNYFSDETWKYFKKNPLHLDFVSLDCTSGAIPEMDYIGHMNLNDNIKTANKLKQLGCADETTKFCCNHFSHNGASVLFEEFSELAEKEGFLVSFDGMEIEF